MALPMASLPTCMQSCRHASTGDYWGRRSYLLILDHVVHGAIVVVVVEGADGDVDGQHLVVDTQAVALCVRVCQHP